MKSVEEKKVKSKISIIGIIIFFMFVLLSHGGTDQDTLQKYANQAEKLGFPAGRKVLILHADDIGMCEEANMAVIPYLENQQIQSASVMMPCEYSDEFMQWYKSNPEYDVGLHLTLTGPWTTVADKNLVPSLLNDGVMWSTSLEVVQNATPSDVEKEIRAQIEKALSLGVLPTHLDTHMATLYASDEFSKIYLDLAEEYQRPALAFDMSSDSIIDKFHELNCPITDKLITRLNNYDMPRIDFFEYIPSGNTYEEFRNGFFNLVKYLDYGITEIIFHPSIYSDKLKDITADWQQRVWESQLFSDPEVINFLREEKIIFTNWKELMKRYFISYVNKDDETCGGNTPCYPTIQAAINAVETESTIRILQGTFDEDIIVNQAYDLTISGGWDSMFTNQSSNTVINSLTIEGTSGIVEIDNIALQ